MKYIRVIIPVLLFSMACALGAAARSTRDGVFTKAQVTRGQNVYRETCSKCHGEELTGGEGSPGLVGDDFKKWQGKTANEFFETIRRTMPADDPGNLSRRQYADITAYLLSANEQPAGEKDLESTAEALGDIRIEMKK